MSGFSGGSERECCRGCSRAEAGDDEAKEAEERRKKQETQYDLRVLRNSTTERHTHAHTETQPAPGLHNERNDSMIRL